ncbi:MAG: hypothetical protein GX491_16140 [Chloroflexi bacterium]|nr:hypothetical protein [Chloroflexota bacterium]
MTQASGQSIEPETSMKDRALSKLGWMYKSLDAVMTASLLKGARKKDLLRSVVRRKSTKYARISSFVSLLDSILPGTALGFANALYGLDRFPVKGYQISLLGFGSGATVFLLENERERKVLKTFRRSLGKPLRTVLQVAKEYRQKYCENVRWFNNRYEVVVPSAYLILHGPLLGATAAAVLQPYIEGRKMDLFEDFTEDEAVQLGQSDPIFRLQLLDFSQQLFAMLREKEVCFDLVGRENLMLVETREGIRLKIADMGVFNVAAVRENSPALYRRFQEHLARLRAIQDRLMSE